VDIRAITEEYREAVNKLLKDEWNCPPSVSRGKTIDTTVLPGYVALSGNRITGIITFNIENRECEIVTLNSFEKNKGIGTAFINAVLAVAKEKGCNRLWLIATNDNIGAIRFYQKKGFDLVAAHINAIETSRKIKPSIPVIGMDGIPIKHELEFEISLCKA